MTGRKHGAPRARVPMRAFCSVPLFGGDVDHFFKLSGKKLRGGTKHGCPTSVPRKSNRNGRNFQRKTLIIYDLRFTIWKVSALRTEGEAEAVRSGYLFGSLKEPGLPSISFRLTAGSALPPESGRGDDKGVWLGERGSIVQAIGDVDFCAFIEVAGDFVRGAAVRAIAVHIRQGADEAFVFVAPADEARVAAGEGLNFFCACLFHCGTLD